MTFPEEIRHFLNEYHKDGISSEDCLSCNSYCCSHAGFAILENVLEIYQIYKNGSLKREDYVFVEGLSFKDFIFTYFDVIKYSDDNIMIFHPRHLTKDNNIISIPDGESSYWSIRSDLFNRNPWLNYGCIFLNNKISQGEYNDNKKRGCILHSQFSEERITTKPIDCIFYVCKEKQRESKTPQKEETTEWFRLLSKHYPKSVKKFEKLIGYKKE